MATHRLLDQRHLETPVPLGIGACLKVRRGRRRTDRRRTDRLFRIVPLRRGFVPGKVDRRAPHRAGAGGPGGLGLVEVRGRRRRRLPARFGRKRLILLGPIGFGRFGLDRRVVLRHVLFRLEILRLVFVRQVGVGVVRGRLLDVFHRLGFRVVPGDVGFRLRLAALVVEEEGLLLEDRLVVRGEIVRLAGMVPIRAGFRREGRRQRLVGQFVEHVVGRGERGGDLVLDPRHRAVEGDEPRPELGVLEARTVGVELPDDHRPQAVVDLLALLLVRRIGAVERPAEDGVEIRHDAPRRQTAALSPGLISNAPRPRGLPRSSTPPADRAPLRSFDQRHASRLICGGGREVADIARRPACRRRAVVGTVASRP